MENKTDEVIKMLEDTLRKWKEFKEEHKEDKEGSEPEEERTEGQKLAGV